MRVLPCIVAGIALGQLAPGAFQAVGRMEVAQVNLPVGLLIWIMVIPMLLRVDFGALGQARQHWKGIGAAPATGPTTCAVACVRGAVRTPPRYAADQRYPVDQRV